MNKPTNLATAMSARAVPASQATQIEQQRAIAQVQAAVIVAQQRPRDEIMARSRMESTCQLQSLADRAFYRYNRAGSQVTGPSIHLATELARCWGNIDYGISELRRDDLKGESEMLAYAWDLETNARNSNTFIVPHKRDKSGGPVALTDMRDIYENNANMGARRLRECIFHVLPKPYTEEAKTMCQATLEHGGGEPIEKRRVALLEAFAKIGVVRKQIEDKMARAADKLTAYDLGVLRVVYQSVTRGEATVADEFPDNQAAQVQANLTKPSAGAPASAAGAGTAMGGTAAASDPGNAPAEAGTAGNQSADAAGATTENSAGPSPDRPAPTSAGAPAAEGVQLPLAEPVDANELFRVFKANLEACGSERAVNTLKAMDVSLAKLKQVDPDRYDFAIELVTERAKKLKGR